MTDFIDAVSNSEQLAVYNEDYSWAEEYAEYYNEESDNYAQPILESSGYQFFGEACFIQEASKGLIAGGILALVSGAFFMIMKLLRNGGSSTSGGKSSTESSKSENKDSTIPPNNGDGNGNNPNAQNANPTSAPTPTPTSPSAVQPQITNPNANSKRSEIKYADLEAEEKLTYSFATIFKKLDEYKKEGYEKVSINGGIHELDRILSGLGLIHDIARIMVDIVEKGNWYLFGSTDQKNPEVREFTKKCDELDELVKTIRTSASTYQKRDNMRDEDLNSVKTVLKDIDKASKAIEATCKKGIDKCKKTREALKNEKKDVSNVDKSYKLLNGIIRNVNIVCKSIQNAFADIQNAADSKRHPFPLNVEYFVLPNIGSMNDPFDEMDVLIENDPSPKSLMPSRIYATCIKAIRAACDKALNVSAYSSISDKQIKLIEEDKYGHFKNSKAALQRSRGDFTKAFALMKKKWPDRVEELEYIEPIISKGYDCLADLLNVPPKQMVGQTQSDTKIPAVINLIKFRNEYLVDTKAVEITNKVQDINYKNHTPFSNGKDTENPNMAKVSDKAYAEKSKIPRYRDLNVGWNDLTAEEQKERERYYSKYKSVSTQTNTRKQKEFEFA